MSTYRASNHVPHLVQQAPEHPLDMVHHGGLIVLDLTPEHVWTPEQRTQWHEDPVRSFWLNDDRVTAIELMVAPTQAVILATRKRD